MGIHDGQKIQPDNSASMKDIVDNGFCAGCGLCVALSDNTSASMKFSRNGYLRPDEVRINNSDRINIIQDCCPGYVVGHSSDKEANGYHATWGPLIGVRTGHAVDPEIHHKGSSGGVISSLCNYLLETKQVSFVAQIAVSQDDPLRNDIQISRTREDVLRAAGSRYAPSAPLENIYKLLDTGETFAFVGKPCDVAALRRYAKYEPRIAKQIPYMFSFMCAGVPSLLGTHELLEKMGADKNKLISFRYRGDGWPGMAKAEQQDGQIFETDYNSSWGTVLNKHLQFRCKICPDGTGEFADVVCADAWYGKDGYPDFTERDGRSLILSRTPAGERLINQAMQAAISVEPLDVNEISLMQPYQVSRKQMVLARLLGTWLARKTLYPRYINLQLVKNAMTAKPVEWLRSMVGTFRRAKGETL